MFTNAEALIATKKELETPNQVLTLNTEKLRIDLIASEEESDYKFFIDAHLSKRIQFKLTLHSQERYSNIGLLRIDYKGFHNNPEHILETCPDFLASY